MTSSRLSRELHSRGCVSSSGEREGAVNPAASACRGVFDPIKLCADLKSSNPTAPLKTFSISLPHELLKVTRLKKQIRVRQPYL